MGFEKKKYEAQSSFRIGLAAAAYVCDGLVRFRPCFQLSAFGFLLLAFS
jgi:hypothetical protein